MSSDLVVERCQAQPVLILGIGVVDGRAGLLQLRLGQLHDGAEPKLVPGLGQLQTGIGLLSQLRGHPDPLISSVRLQPRGAHVAHDLVAQLAGALLLRARAIGCFLGF